MTKELKKEFDLSTTNYIKVENIKSVEASENDKKGLLKSMLN